MQLRRFFAEFSFVLENFEKNLHLVIDWLSFLLSSDYFLGRFLNFFEESGEK